MVNAPHKLSPRGAVGHGGVERRLQDQLCLVAGLSLMNVPQAVKEPEIPWSVSFAEATQHPPVGLEEGEEARRPLFMHLAAGLFLLRLMDQCLAVPLQRPLATGQVRIQPPADVDSPVAASG
jgi:hypothetical protein